MKGAAAIDALEALASPHRVFLDEMCEEGPMFEVECEALYLTWRKWCENNGREHKGTKQRFARDLRTVCPTLPKPVRRGTGRVRVYPGLGLK
jgi:putative DNA primase/helicase